MGERPKDIKAIFSEALEKKTAEERAAYLDGVCGDDAALRSEFESLLRVHDEAGDFLEAPMIDFGATQDGSPLTEAPGTVIGPYKLLELIGEGGFGAVYMAEQERPIRRRVALKIIKLGMDTKQVIGRFEAERQALAMMDHPNIAKVFEAGSTERGRPYFAMELVKGVPITEYCDANSLDTQQRLALFIDVCRAVEHAHQKGIIHRDIKPSNVMVALHDGRPVVKVIDFGIAKATQHRLTEKTLFTESRQLIGTPEYMSPEQAESGGLDVDIRTDVYSLGVLLYELLTGTTPFEREKLRSASYDEICKIIRENELPKPSTRVSRLGAGLADAAKHRQVEPGELCKIIRGDLDWITMKAVEKDRTRRYEAASELAADIERHLGDVPVSAGPPSVGYRLHKFVWRNRAAVITVALVTAALAIGATTAKFISLTLGPSTPEHAEGMAQRHIWNLPYYATPSGTISSDGQIVSYIDWAAGNLGVHNISEETNLLITHNVKWADTGGWPEYSVVSPDGRQVVHSWRNEKSNGFYDLRIANTDGSNELLLYRSDLVWWTRPCDWSTDGQYVLACFTDKQASEDSQDPDAPQPHRHLALISATDASVQIIKTWYNRESPQAAFFSPDSLHVAYDLQQTNDRAHRDVYLLNLNDESDTALVTHPADDRLLGWSPDGRWILFSSDRTGPRSLWAIQMTNGTPAKPAIRLVQQFDGSHVGFTEDNAFYYGMSINTIDAHIAALDVAGLAVEGSPGKASSRFVGRTGNSDWSPDGRFLAFSTDTGSGSVSERGPAQWALGLLSVETGQERLVTPSSPISGSWGRCAPRWAPDGESVLVFGVTDEHGRGPYTVNVTTGQVNLIKADQWEAGGQAVWSADGTAVYVRAVSDRISDEMTISRIDVTTGRQIELYNQPGAPKGLDISPDGQWLAFWQNDASLVIIPAEGGEPRQVVHLVTNEQNEIDSFVRWTPDGVHLLFPKRLFQLWRVDIRTGQQQPMGLTARGLVDAVIHPDGHQIAFTVKQPGHELWVLENFLPD
jgi:serine/threonine protein kinase